MTLKGPAFTLSRGFILYKVELREQSSRIEWELCSLRRYALKGFWT